MTTISASDAPPGDVAAALSGVGPWRAGRAAVLRRAALTVAALLALLAAWEVYKALGPVRGVHLGDVSVLPRTDDSSMPHSWDVLARLVQPVSGVPGSPPLGGAVLAASAVTLGIAGAGFVLGSVLGVVLALAMARVRLAERALFPWVVLSQTVPLIALAPLVVTWGSLVALPGLAWQPWMSVAVIAGYLAFFPITVGLLRGLQSPEAVHRDLFTAQAVGWWATLLRLRLPASVPYLLPALRLGAASAVIGAIVAEVSTGTAGGIGRTIIEYAISSSGDPAKPWASILGAVLVGLLAAGLVGLTGLALRRFRRGEAA